MNETKPINIFIVEDNKVFTLALKSDIETAFMGKAMKIHSFETGEACMEKFREIKPQVVIIDYHLNSKYPHAMDGIKVLDWIKKENSSTSVIMLTGDDHLDIAIKSFKHGAADYVVKSDTKFRKVNYSLVNIFRLMEAKNEARKYRNLVVGLSVCVLLLVGGMISIQIFNPSILK